VWIAKALGVWIPAIRCAGSSVKGAKGARGCRGVVGLSHRGGLAALRAAPACGPYSLRGTDVNMV